MYGYVRPLKGELKVLEYESFHGIYCALCRELSRRGGFFARFVVNYDFTFLAMLLSQAGEIRCEQMRCPARLWRKRSCVCVDASLAEAADESIILAWWKLTDAVADSGFAKALIHRAARVLLRPAYRKAVLERPAFAETVQQCLAELSALEAEKCASLDAVADTFARILQATVVDEPDEKRRRALQVLMYQLGRYIYILDAVDDLADDRKTGSYNPLAVRYPAESGRLTNEQIPSVRALLCQSQNSIAAAFALLDANAWQSILSNVIYYGLPWASESVLSGNWNKRNKRQESL